MIIASSPPIRLARLSCVALLGSALVLTGCVKQKPYAPRGEIAVAPAADRLGAEVVAKLTEAVESHGDFHPNDLIRISFPYFPAMTSEQRVQLSGEISPPMLDPIQTRGMTSSQLQSRLSALYRAKLAKPVVSVSVLEYHTPPPVPELFVMGEVGKPGAYPYRKGVTLFEALARAGGPGRDADLGQVVMLTPVGDTVVAEMVDLDSVLNGDVGSMQQLLPFSVIIVPQSYIGRTADRARAIRQIIGFNGINFGSSVTLVSP